MACVLGAEIDQPTADLIVQLQIQDVELYSETSKSKSREPTDEELAFRLQNEELETVSQYFGDRRMAMSFAAAVETDGHVVAESQLEEERASKDRHIACHLESAGFAVSPDGVESETAVLDDETLTKLQLLYVSGLKDYQDIDATDSETEQAESSAWGARRRHQSRPRRHQCVVCREETHFVDVARVPCQHEYCRSCLEELFKASMADESLFPPRCCRQPIKLNVARIFLKSELVQQYETKKIEFETPNRTYCYNPECSTFIGQSHIDGEVATCPNCKRTTCTNCKGRAHTGDCPDDIGMQQLLSTAQENGWQRCYSCWRMVELNHGCNHMTCPCGVQFCYNCGEVWKTCTCDQWNEHRLLARAYQVIDREAPPPDIDEPRVGTPEARPGDENERPNRVPPGSLAHARTSRDALVARTVEELRETHECGHARWRCIRGPHLCEECYHYLPHYIFECRQCRLQACNRCRRNRL